MNKKYIRWIWLVFMTIVNTGIVMNWEQIDPYLKNGTDAIGPMGFWFMSLIIAGVIAVIITAIEDI